ncbi:MAG: hypothetical protein AAB614_01005 [Patescibacteria group bacterium]
MTKKSKISLVIIIIILIVGSVFAYYLLVVGKKPTIIKEKDTPNKEIIISTTEKSSKLVQITDENVVSPAINEEKKRIRYITKNDGVLYQSDLKGENKIKIPFVSLGGIIKIIWTEDQEKFINIYSDSFGVKSFFYDLASKQAVPLNKNITWLDYSKNTDKIFYHYYDSSQSINSIATSNSDGSLSKSIINTRLQDVRLQWITDKKIAISTAPSGLAQNILYTLNPESPKFIKILSGIYGLTHKWSSDGSKFAFSQTDKDGASLTLNISNESGLEISNTRIITLPEKCVFMKDNISLLCAEMLSVPENAIMPDDYYKKTFIANNRLWKLNTETNKKDIIYDFNEDINFDLDNLTLTNDEKYLYFTNRANGFLYRLEL